MPNVSNCRIAKYFMGGATANYNENMTERVAILISLDIIMDYSINEK